MVSLYARSATETGEIRHPSSVAGAPVVASLVIHEQDQIKPGFSRAFAVNARVVTAALEVPLHT